MDLDWHALDAFLGDLNAQQRSDLAHVILNWQPTDTHVISATHVTTATPPMRNKLSASANKGKSSKPKFDSTAIVLAAKRPLNSWMAFRCFYAHIFAHWQQKEISGFLTRMWQSDPFKAKWTIVAKAYSIIRDQVGKDRAPLGEFLQIVCPLVGIISPADYLDMLGWMKPHGGVTEMVRWFVPDMNQFGVQLRVTNISADDIVRHCREIGYIVNEPSKSKSIEYVPHF